MSLLNMNILLAFIKIISYVILESQSIDFYNNDSYDCKAQ